MGFNFKGGAAYYHKIIENINKIKEEYPYKDGLFGERGNSGTNSVRNIKSDNPTEKAKQFYDSLTYGGIEKELYYKDGTVKGYQTKMADGTILNWRPVSSSADGSPSVDIDVQYSNECGDLVTQKIHFVKG